MIMALAKKVFQLLISSCLFIVGSEAQSSYQKDSILQYLHKSGEFQEAEKIIHSLSYEDRSNQSRTLVGKLVFLLSQLPFIPMGESKKWNTQTGEERP